MCVCVCLSVTVCATVCVWSSVEHKDKPILTWPGTAEGNGRVADGAIVEMHCLDEQGPQNIICYATSMGRVHGMDIRVGQPVWTVQQEYKTGLSHTCTRTCTHTLMHTCTHMHMCKHAFTHAHTYTHTHMHAHTHTHARTHTHAHTDTHTHTHAQSTLMRTTNVACPVSASSWKP